MSAIPSTSTSTGGCGVNLEEHMRTLSGNDDIIPCSTVDECDTVKLIEDLEDRPLKSCHIRMTTLNLIIIILLFMYVCILTAFLIQPSEQSKPIRETDTILKETFILPYNRTRILKLLGENVTSCGYLSKIEMKNRIIFVMPDTLLFDCTFDDLIGSSYCNGSDFRNYLLTNAINDNYKDMIYNFIIGADGRIYEGRPYDCPIGKKHELNDINEKSSLVFGIGWCFSNTSLSEKKTSIEFYAVMELIRYLLSNNYLNSTKFDIELPLDCQNSLLAELIMNNLTLFDDIKIEDNTNSTAEVNKTFYTSQRITDWETYGNYSLESVRKFKENYTELNSKFPDYFPEPGVIYSVDWKRNHSKSCKPLSLTKPPEIKIIGLSYKLNNEPICCKTKNCYKNAMNNLQVYHFNKDYSDINFHYIIFRSGYIGEGRPLNCKSEDGNEIIIGLDYPITNRKNDCNFDKTNVVRTYRTISKILNGIRTNQSIRMCGNTTDKDMINLNLLLNLTFSVNFDYGNSTKDTCSEWDSISIHDNSTDIVDLPGRIDYS